jgi:hypothetical protein
MRLFGDTYSDAKTMKRSQCRVHPPIKAHLPIAEARSGLSPLSHHGIYLPRDGKWLAQRQ